MYYLLIKICNGRAMFWIDGKYVDWPCYVKSKELFAYNYVVIFKPG